MLVYDISRPPTFETVAKWKKEIDEKVYLPNGKKLLGLQFWTLLDPFGKLTRLTCLAIFVCFIGAFFGTPPTTIDHRIFAANGGPMERRLLGDLMKSYNKLERPVLLKVSINSKYFLMHHCVFL